jgi:hypothetical protein
MFVYYKMEKIYYVILAVIITVVLLFVYFIFISNDTTPICGTGLKRKVFTTEQQDTFRSMNGFEDTIFNVDGRIVFTGTDSEWERWAVKDGSGQEYGYLCECDKESGEVEEFKRIDGTTYLQPVCAVNANCGYCRENEGGNCKPVTDIKEVDGSCIQYNITEIGDGSSRNKAVPYKCKPLDGYNKSDEYCSSLYPYVWDGGVPTGDMSTCNGSGVCEMANDFDKWPRICDTQSVLEVHTINKSRVSWSDYPQSEQQAVVSTCRDLCNDNSDCNSFSLTGRDTTRVMSGTWECSLHPDIAPGVKERNNGGAVGWRSGCFTK